MYTLFELDEHYALRLQEASTGDDPSEKHMSVSFSSRLLDDFMKEWLLRKQELSNGIITHEEYMEWKVNWPRTADGCGKHQPSIPWRKNIEK